MKENRFNHAPRKRLKTDPEGKHFLMVGAFVAWSTLLSVHHRVAMDQIGHKHCDERPAAPPPPASPQSAANPVSLEGFAPARSKSSPRRFETVVLIKARRRRASQHDVPRPLAFFE